MGGKYKSSIEFNSRDDMLGHSLNVELKFERPVTQKDYESMLDYYQWKFSKNAGRQIPRDEITVEPGLGELTECDLYFTAKLGSPLYGGLKDVHQRALYVLPRFIEELDNYQRVNHLRHMDLKLLHHVINGLMEIVGPKDKPNSLGKHLLPFFSRSKKTKIN